MPPPPTPPKTKSVWSMVPEKRLEEIADLARQILERIPRKHGLAVRKRRRVVRKKKT